MVSDKSNETFRIGKVHVHELPSLIGVSESIEAVTKYTFHRFPAPRVCGGQHFGPSLLFDRFGDEVYCYG